MPIVSCLLPVVGVPTTGNRVPTWGSPWVRVRGELTTRL
jgi:hypothetical protein